MSKDSFDRRSFLKGAAASAAAMIGSQIAATNAPLVQAAEGGAAAGEGAPARGKMIGRPGSDYMVDVIKATGIEYIASNPGSSFRSLQESIINYGGNKKPEFLTCTHEESSVAMAHGYAKAAGKPMGIMAHGTVGLQHATMAVYNAWCDRVPVMMFAGNFLDADKRRPGGRADSGRKKAPHAQVPDVDSATGRHRRGDRSGQAAGRRTEPGDRGRPRLPLARWHQAHGRIGRSAQCAGGRHRRADEFPDQPFSLSQRVQALADRPSGRGSAPGSRRSMGSIQHH